LAGLSAAGCDEGLFGTGTRVDSAPAQRTLGVLSFHASTVVGGASERGRGLDRFAVEARFVRYDSPFELEVRGLLGLADLDVLPPADRCVAGADRGSPVQAVASAGRGIDLLDVGRVLLETPGAREELAVRTFPDLLDVMSGVTYGGLVPFAYRPGQTYTVRGSADRTAWVAVEGPPGWNDLRVNGMDATAGAAAVLDDSRYLELRWTPWRLQTSDVVLTLLWSDAGGLPRSIVCHLADDGAFVLPPDAAILLPAAPDLSDLTLRIDRAVRVSFPLDRVDEAEAVFRVSLVVPIS
jgi:hypothetical protein